MVRSRLTSRQTDGYGRARHSISLALLFLPSLVSAALGQLPASQGAGILKGTVRDSKGQPLAAASVSLERKGDLNPLARQTDLNGAYTFSDLSAGLYFLRAGKAGFRDAALDRIELSPGEIKRVDLTLAPLSTGKPVPSGAADLAASPPEKIDFEDKPNFIVAGLSDWTGAGGHGSDTRLETSEALTQETLSLKQEHPSRASNTSPGQTASGSKQAQEKQLREAVSRAPESFQANHQLGEFYFRSERFRDAIPFLKQAYRINPGDYSNAYTLASAYTASGEYPLARDQVRALLAKQDRAELHHGLGEIDERRGDPLEAVREYERAVRLDPSEQNYFDWGTELLLHRATAPAVEVFSEGHRLHPNSARILAGWGVALYARGSYEDAVRRLCQASDLNPGDPRPYLFLGKMESVSPSPLAGVDEALARFARMQPEDALAQYYYALSLWKRQRGSGNAAPRDQVKLLLERAVELDPKLGEGYLQLGILYSEESDFEQAIHAFRKAIEASPRLGEAHYRMALAYKRTGEELNAQREFQVYQQLTKQKSAEDDARRREIQQFVYISKGQPSASEPQ